MGVTEERMAARVADTIARRGETFTLQGGGTIRAIVDSDYDSVTNKVGIEAVEDVRESGSRVSLLYVTPASAALIPRGTSITDTKGVRWSCEPGRELKPDDTGMMVSLLAKAGKQE